MKVLQKSDTSRRLMERSIRLGEFDIRYEGRPSLKSQVLVDFVNEFSWDEEISPIEPKEEWSIYTDGALSAEGAGLGVVIKGPDAIRLYHTAKLTFK
ncbi:hypothetical protein M5689_018975 [Euphorbia peplus]|nr:hypothetical protein M5689_018975 [Euphorbia peplus]